MPTLKNPALYRRLARHREDASIDEQAKQMRAKQRQAYAPLAADMLATFSTPQGQRVLEFLLDRTLRQSPWVVGSKLRMDQITAFGLHHAGANMIVQLIIDTMRQGQRQENDNHHHGTGD